MYKRTLFAFAAFLLLFAACAPAEQNDAEPADEPADDAPPTELMSAADRYVDAWNGDDPSAVAAFYTEDATVNDGNETFQGRAEIEERWAGEGLPIVSDLRDTESSWEATNGDWRDYGRYSHMLDLPDQDAFEVTGDYSHIWTQDPDGEWRISSSNIEPDEMPQDDRMEDDQAQD